MLERACLFFFVLIAPQSVKADIGGEQVTIPEAGTEGSRIFLRQERDFDIAALPLGQAALVFSDQARMQLLMDPAVASGIRSAPLKGRYAIDHALDILLLDTPLQWRRVGEHTVTIEPASRQLMNLLGPLRIESAGDGRANPDGRTAWEDAVLRRMDRAKSYPPEARRVGMEDTVYVRVLVDRDGNILRSVIVRSRGHALLDRAVLDLMKRVDPLPPPPVEEGANGLSFIVPVEFVLRHP